VYVWLGELVSLNETARTATVKAQIPDYVAQYVDRFKTGDRLVLVWNMITFNARVPDGVLSTLKSANVANGSKSLRRSTSLPRTQRSPRLI
jgi:hypothetical protein